MRKMFAPLAMLFGLLTAMLLGSTAVAQATPILNVSNCVNAGVNLVTCSDVLNNITVNITDNDPHVLTNNELTLLTDNLNKAKISVDILNINVAKNQVVTVYNNTINPSPHITVGNVTICLLAVCK